MVLFASPLSPVDGVPHMSKTNFGFAFAFAYSGKRVLPSAGAICPKFWPDLFLGTNQELLSSTSSPLNNLFCRCKLPAESSCSARYGPQAVIDVYQNCRSATSFSPAPPLHKMAPSNNRNLYLAAVVSCLTAGLFGYSVGFIGGEIVLPSFLQHFQLDHLPENELASARSWAVSAWIVGALVGVPSGMPVCSRLGRRLCLQFAAVLYVVGAVMQVCSNGNLLMYVCPRKSLHFVC